MDCFAGARNDVAIFPAQYQYCAREFNDVGGNGPRNLYRVASSCTPDAGKAGGALPRTGTFQISSAYSRMVRSEENHGIRATLRIEARVHAGTTCQRASMPDRK